MDHLRNIKKAFQITWKNKFLWILGFIAIFFQQNPGFNTNYTLTDFKGLPLEDGFTKASSWWLALDNYLQVALLLGSALFFVILALIIMYLVARAEASLIAAVNELDQGMHLSFAKAWSLGGAKAWNLAGQRFMLNFPFVIIGVVVAMFSAFILLSMSGTNIPTATTISNLTPLLPIFILLGVLACFFSFFYALFTGILFTFSSRNAVIEKNGVFDSFKQGFEIFKINISDVIVSWLVNVAVSIPVGFVILGIYFFSSLILVLPLILVLFALAVTNIFLFIAVIIVLLLFVQVLTSLVGGFLAAFNSAYWTIVYNQLHKKK
jgi:hypothetical protein